MIRKATEKRKKSNQCFVVCTVTVESSSLITLIVIVLLSRELRRYHSTLYRKQLTGIDGPFVICKVKMDRILCSLFFWVSGISITSSGEGGTKGTLARFKMHDAPCWPPHPPPEDYGLWTLWTDCSMWKELLYFCLSMTFFYSHMIETRIRNDRKDWKTS